MLSEHTSPMLALDTSCLVEANVRARLEHMVIFLGTLSVAVGKLHLAAVAFGYTGIVLRALLVPTGLHTLGQI